MPHVDITMIPGRNNAAKKALALKVQSFLAKELGIEESLISVSIEDVPIDSWKSHMEELENKVMFVSPQH